ncbi:MAG: hypothetical protein SVX43_16315 [Cyanobacteriota bacterium]|nr:hypothetical protein [Cyanobacteriota bacterium]
MTPDEITPVLTALFPEATVQQPSAETWQVEQPPLRLLAILSEDESWLRLLVAIAPFVEAQPYLAQILEANFDLTQEVRYAASREVLWGVFQHCFASLTRTDFEAAIARLVELQARGLSPFFNQLIEDRLRQIVRASKQQGQTLQTTLQNIERFYAEGMLGNLQQDPQEREQFIAAWRAQLERLWNEVDV